MPLTKMNGVGYTDGDTQTDTQPERLYDDLISFLFFNRKVC